MRTTELKDLLKTVQAKAKELHPDLDVGFLQAVVRAEQENADDGAAALQDIEKALEASLGRKRSK